jgi:hypothetical protein
MAEDDELAVALGEHRPVDGAPLARVSARLMWGIEKSSIERREGDTVVRTPDGPRTLADLLEEVDQSYFSTRQEFEDAVHEVTGTGPIPTADEDAERTEKNDSADGPETSEPADGQNE